MKIKKVLSSVIVLFFASASFAEIWMPKIFSNNMVLQANENVKIWGRADVGSKVEIEFADIKTSAKVGKDGKWVAYLKPLEKSFENRTMNVYENGTLAKTIKNILVGEVWVAGGQSNMHWEIQKCEPEAMKAAIESAKDIKAVRFLRMHSNATNIKPQEELPNNAQWASVKSDNCKFVSAIAFYFAQKLEKDLDTPVGILEVPFSGSFMSVWLAKEDLQNVNGFKEQLAKYEAENKNFDYKKEMDAYNERVEKYKAQVEKVKAEGGDVKAIKKPSGKPEPWGRGRFTAIPSIFYNAKIAPLAGYTAKGFLWYQGESDATIHVEHYAEKFEQLINCWRKYWGKNDMPFYFFQLPSMDRDFWIGPRQAQEDVAKKLKNVHMVVHIDLGEEKDVHPKDKLSPATRLENLVKRFSYNDKTANAYYPSVAKIKYSGNCAKVILNFEKSKPNYRSELTGFEVLVDEKWCAPEKVKVSGKTIEVFAPKGAKVVGVRYLHKGWARPLVSVFNDGGLPLAPFSDVKK